MKFSDKKEREEALKYFEAEKTRLEALIDYLEGGGGVNFDCATPHILFQKNIPEDLQNKKAADFLQEYRDLLQQVTAALEDLKG